MLNVDRHIAIWAGWIAGPAFGVAMMAAPEYLHLGPLWSALLFWGGIVVFMLTIVVVIVLSIHDRRERRIVLGPVLLMSISALGFCVGAAWYFWPRPTAVNHSRDDTLVSPQVVKEFERARVPNLGNPLRPIETTTSVYQAAHERAMVVSLLPVLDVFVLPKDRTRKAIRHHHAKIDEDRKWWDDAYLRSRFRPPKGKNPPEYRVAELWSENLDQWKWIGWREWSCPFSMDTFYYQIFESGIIFGVLPTSETLGSSQIFMVLNSGEWSSIAPEDKVGGLSAPACNEKTAKVRGIPLRGHFVR